MYKKTVELWIPAYCYSRDGKTEFHDCETSERLPNNYTGLVDSYTKSGRAIFYTHLEGDNFEGGRAWCCVKAL